jgi:hypothetical protein
MMWQKTYTPAILYAIIGPAAHGQNLARDKFFERALCPGMLPEIASLGVVGNVAFV